jgi:hypothetical protein
MSFLYSVAIFECMFIPFPYYPIGKQLTDVIFTYPVFLSKGVLIYYKKLILKVFVFLILFFIYKPDRIGSTKRKGKT